MKILLFILIGITTLAQDSVSVNNEQYAFNSSEKTYINGLIPLPSTLIELKMNRSWMRDSLQTTTLNNSASVIKFKGDSENFIDSDLFFIAVGSAVVFGAAAAYFKLESDASYDKYLLTDKISYKEKTDRYDLYSGIALGVMELNFGFLIYKFLTD